MLLCCDVEIVCCYVVMSHFTLLKDAVFFVGLHCLWCKRSVIQCVELQFVFIFRIGSLDKTVLRSVNLGAFVVRVLSMSCFV